MTVRWTSLQTKGWKKQCEDESIMTTVVSPCLGDTGYPAHSEDRWALRFGSYANEDLSDRSVWRGFVWFPSCGVLTEMFHCSSSQNESLYHNAVHLIYSELSAELKAPDGPFIVLIINRRFLWCCCNVLIVVVVVFVVYNNHCVVYYSSSKIPTCLCSESVETLFFMIQWWT